MPQNFFHIYVPLCLIKYALPQVLPIAHAALNLSFLYLTLAINSYSCHLDVILLVPEKFDPKRSSQRRSWAWTSEKKQRSKFLGSASLRVQYGPISLSHIKEVVDSRFPDASLMFLSACSPTFHPLTWSWVPMPTTTIWTCSRLWEWKVLGWHLGNLDLQSLNNQHTSTLQIT